MKIKRKLAYIRKRWKVHKAIREYNRLEKKAKADKDPDGGFVDEWRKLP